MIKNAAILFLLLSISSCATQNNIENVTEIEIIKNANAFMDSWHQAASDANFENYFGKMDTQSVFIGTDASENWTKQQFEAYSNQRRGRDYYARNKESLPEAFAYLDKLGQEGILSSEVLSAVRALTAEGVFDPILEEARGEPLARSERRYLRSLTGRSI